MTQPAPDGPTGADEAQTGPLRVPPAQRAERRGRSNEFYLALAGIAATVVVGLVGAGLAYQTSSHQIAAESDRAALTFTRDQRKSAYTDFLSALSDLDRAEFNLRFAYDPSIAASGAKQLEDQFREYTEATDKMVRTSGTVRLLASKDVGSAREAIHDDHHSIYQQIHALMTAAKRGDPPTVLDQLRKKIGDASSDLEERFIDAAKKDLGVGE